MEDPAGDEVRIRETAYLLWERAGRPEGRAEEFWQQAQAELKSDEDQYDKTLEDSFPASDPPSTGGVTGPRTRTGKERTIRAADE